MGLLFAILTFKRFSHIIPRA